MDAKEFYRKRLVELTPEGIMKRLNKIVNIDKEAQICEEYHSYKVEELNSPSVTRRFSSEKELRLYIEMNMPIGVKPIKPAKTVFVAPFTSNNAQDVVTNAIIKCLLNGG